MSNDFKVGVLIGLGLLAMMVIFLTNRPATDEAAELASQSSQDGAASAQKTDTDGQPAQLAAADQATSTHEPWAIGGPQPAANEVVIMPQATDDRTVGAVMTGGVQTPAIGPQAPPEVVTTDQTQQAETVAVAPQPQTPKPQHSFPLKHKVAKGQTLADISFKYYGTHKLYYHIYNANRRALRNPNAVYCGQKLTVPAPPEQKAPQTTVVAKADAIATKPSFSPRTHKVQKGDNLWRIADTYYNGDESMWQKILKANRARIKDANKLPVGVTLVIPPI